MLPDRFLDSLTLLFQQHKLHSFESHNILLLNGKCIRIFCLKPPVARLWTGGLEKPAQFPGLGEISVRHCVQTGFEVRTVYATDSNKRNKAVGGQSNKITSTM